MVCPLGASCTTVPEKTVVFTTATILEYDGGANAFGDDKKAKFESAIEETMAAGAIGANGVTATVMVTGVTDTSRRLSEGVASVVSLAYDGMLELASKTLGVTTREVMKYIDFDGLKALSEPKDEALDHTHRFLSAIEVKVDYTITVAANDNTAVSDFNAIKVKLDIFIAHTLEHYYALRTYTVNTIARRPTHASLAPPSRPLRSPPTTPPSLAVAPWSSP